MLQLETIIMDWKTTLSFIVSATLLILLGGWLLEANVLPIPTELNYSQTEQHLIRIWLQAAVVIGLILPGISFLAHLRRPRARSILGFYLLVLIIQIITEQILSGVFPSGLVLIIGSLYTAFRVWQLWQGQQLMRADAEKRSNRDRGLLGLLWLMLLFWSANLIVLGAIGWSQFTR
ncbi:hypothetical protein H6G00_31695 [Leptolyngbya sp. FACHB-541]|nr:hypothetical protein [Leptolyngbya sp. FACHB-541]